MRPIYRCLIVAALAAAAVLLYISWTGDAVHRESGDKITEPVMVDRIFNQQKSVEVDLNAHASLQELVRERDPQFMDALSQRYGPIRYSGVETMDTTLTKVEEQRYQNCVQNGPRDRKVNGSKFWAVANTRTQNHSYLKREDAVMIEVGGNIGNDASRFINLYNPRYIILEPLEAYYKNLTKRFHSNSKVTVLNVGLGKANKILLVQVEGNNACATSQFSTQKGETPLYIANTTEFLLKLGVGLFDVDLMTLNCEGCEYDVMETLVTSSLVKHFKNIQWATHSTLPNLERPIERYCRIHELLSRTHIPTYLYSFIWESWKRRDLK